MSCIPINDFSLITLCDATKAGKLYSIVPDTGAGDFDVTRASTATYFGSDGLIKTAANNEPRIEFNKDGSYKGLLVEPASTNSLRRSFEHDQFPWSDNGVTRNTGFLAPDGSTNGVQSVADTSTGAHWNQNSSSVSLLDGQTITCSVFVKFGGYPTVRLQFLGSSPVVSYGNIDFNFLTETISGASSGRFEKHKDDWYKISFTIVLTSNHPSFILRVANINSSGGVTFTGDGTSGFISWGAQVELGSVATSYIPTEASSVTRVADVIGKTGVSSLIGQTQGVIQLQGDLITSGLNQTIAELYDDTDNYINIRKNTSNEIEATLVVAGSTVGTVTSAVQNTGKKDITFSYQTGTCTLTIDGVDTTATATAVPATDKIKVGARQNDTEFWNSHIQLTALRPQL